VTIALLEDNVPVAYGIVRDLSEIGACIMTDAMLKPGTSFQFRMSFFGDILEATARIIWSETPQRGAPETEIPHGLEFVEMGDTHLTHLKRILDTGAFGVKNSH
jgi:hypothetical protein